VSISPVLSALREQAQALTERAHVPFSNSPTAAVLLLSDGTWVPGVRVESASYSLTLPALLNAYTTAVAAERGADVAAFVLSRPFRREERLYVEELPHGSFEARADDAWVRGRAVEDGGLPTPTDVLDPVLDDSVKTETIETEEEGLSLVRHIAERAYVPSSDFPVGAVLELDDGRLLPGVNVEHPDWARILCAERNALGTAQSYDLGSTRRLFLTCAKDPDGTPCGACRQLLAELAPDIDLCMDRHGEAPERAPVSALLPGSFRGRALLDA
jgi:homotetrameric cytidine deaminase